MRRIIFSLEPRPPFRLDLTAWAIRRRPSNQMDVWDGEAYRRVLAIQGKPALISVTQRGRIDAPRLELIASGDHVSARLKNVIVLAFERLLGLRIDLLAFYELASKQPPIRELASRFRGQRRKRPASLQARRVHGLPARNTF